MIRCCVREERVEKKLPSDKLPKRRNAETLPTELLLIISFFFLSSFFSNHLHRSQKRFMLTRILLTPVLLLITALDHKTINKEPNSTSILAPTFSTSTSSSALPSINSNNMSSSAITMVPRRWFQRGQADHGWLKVSIVKSEIVFSRRLSLTFVSSPFHFSDRSYLLLRLLLRPKVHELWSFESHQRRQSCTF